MSIYQKCDRCGSELRTYTMSKFNEDILCVDCKDDETQAPGYAAAAAAELEQVKLKNYSFPGVGLKSSDWAFLAARRRERSKQ